ncbi:MAG: LysR family transcriptional regulator, partial [Pyramidobacter sp.]|nr:LysR family transcriptional regulator [Pyramidobacter sp.]
MDFKDAKIYLELSSTRSITQTARAVGLTQSAVTQRLQSLEREFGLQLVVRERGQKTVEFTRHGARLLPIVQQWIDLYETARSLKDEVVKTLMKVACTDSIGSWLLPGFFLQYAQEHRDISLSIHSHHSWEIFRLMEEGVIDIGLTNRESTLQHDQLQVTPLYSEPYVLLTSVKNIAEYGAGPVDPKNLDIGRELFFEMSPSFKKWRKTLWEEKKPFIQMSFAQPMPVMLTGTPYWTILPLSAARFFAAHYPLEYRRLTEEPERRLCSLVLHKNYRMYKSEQKEAFVRELKDFFKKLQ